VAQKSVNLKHSSVLTGMYRFKHASQFLERHSSVLSCAVDIEDLVRTILVNSVSNKEINNVF
jgi:hypothetical protein